MQTAEQVTLDFHVGRADYCKRFFDVVAAVDTAADNAAALAALKQATHALGADASVFTSFVRDDATVSSYRYLLACDPVWGLQYASNGWCLDDPWLHYALYNSLPIRAEELPPLSERQRWVAEGAALFGFASALIVPAPSPAAQSRVGALCLGSKQPNFFSGEGYLTLRIMARSLAMELGDWRSWRATTCGC